MNPGLAFWALFLLNGFRQLLVIFHIFGFPGLQMAVNFVCYFLPEASGSQIGEQR